MKGGGILSPPPFFVCLTPKAWIEQCTTAPGGSKWLRHSGGCRKI